MMCGLWSVDHGVCIVSDRFQELRSHLKKKSTVTYYIKMSKTTNTRENYTNFFVSCFFNIHSNLSDQIFFKSLKKTRLCMKLYKESLKFYLLLDPNFNLSTDIDLICYIYNNLLFNFYLFIYCM